MDHPNEAIRVFFVQTHGELLTVQDTAEATPETSAFHHLLTEQGFELFPVQVPLTSELLADCDILVLGAPKREFDAEIEIIRHFFTGGGSLLLVTDARTMINPLVSLNELSRAFGMEFREYLNYPPAWLSVFFPHYITANLDKVKVDGVAVITCSESATPLALTRATQEPIIACATEDKGRIVAVGDLHLFTADFSTYPGNARLIQQLFEWLAGRNPVDIQRMVIPQTLKWGQSETVALTLYNHNAINRPQVECVLQSDQDAFIAEPTRKVRSLPPGKTTLMQWTVTPQVLGNQELRLDVEVVGDTPISLHFDRLHPAMYCEAPGYLTLQVKKTSEDNHGEPETTFHTGDQLTVEGTFQATTAFPTTLYKLDLEHPGLIRRGEQPGEGIKRWYLKAVSPGEYELKLKLARPCAPGENTEETESQRATGQVFVAMMKVRPSLEDRIAELHTAFVRPLDVEIAARLQSIDPRLGSVELQQQPFEILIPEQYIPRVYDQRAGLWLQQVLNDARRERWYNLELLNNVLSYFAPTYVPDVGSFVPYDPALVSHLTHLHPDARWRLENNFLASEETDAITVKQNIAALILHEKYGHGFFYTFTRLGQQLAILERNSQELSDFRDILQTIRDSAVIVNEGFAAWLELTFLKKLDREVRQAAYPRRVALLQEATGLYGRRGRFFQDFPPRFDSPYREGFEYFEFISQNFNLYCAICVLLLATDVDLGVSEVKGKLCFEPSNRELWHETVEKLLFDPENEKARSQMRLSSLVNLLYANRRDLELLVRTQNCPADCHKFCVLKTFTEEHLNWR